jgi:hypothetical protein
MDTPDGIAASASTTPSKKLKSRWSEESANTRYHQLQDAAMKDTAGVGVKLRHIYSSGRCSHHPNSDPRPAKPNPNYRAKRPNPPPHRRRSRRRKREPAQPVEIGWKERCLPNRLSRLGQGAKRSAPRIRSPHHKNEEKSEDAINF